MKRRQQNLRGSGTKRYHFITDVLRNPAAYILMLPALAYTLIFGYLTLPYMIIAFQRYNYQDGIFGSEFCGLDNFEFFFRSNTAWQVTFNTLFLNTLFLAATTVTALTVAILINELNLKWFNKVVQSTFIFPNFISYIIVSYILFSLFSMENGLINRMLESLGMDPVGWYADASYWPVILTLVKVWNGMGINTVIYLAVLTGFDSSVLEAASIDGATRWKKIRYIVLPMLTPTICILTLMSVGKIFYGDFGMIYALIKDNGMLYATTDVIDTYVYRALRQTGDPSMAMAVGVYQSVLGFLIVTGANKLTKHFYPEGALF